MTGHHDTLRWFPLVARPRPACPPLDDRIADLATTIGRARTTAGVEALTLAAVVHNKAALIASDCGLPELAETLCLQQVRLYQLAQPLDAQSARHALEPVVSLARLKIRAGNADQAHQLLTALLAAAKERTSLTVAGHTVEMANLLTDAAHHDTVRWLWTVLLADGTRALTTAGRWTEALDTIQQHAGIGDRLLDGRQVAVIAHCHTGDADTARRFLEAIQPSENWEHSVRQTLRLLCDRTSPSRSEHPALSPRLLNHTVPGPELVVFRTRLTLAAIDLTTDATVATALHEALHTDPAVFRDGYAARDVLAHSTAHQLPPTERTLLKTTVHTAGLDNSIQPAQLRRLLDATRASETITTRHLRTTASTPARSHE